MQDFNQYAQLKAPHNALLTKSTPNTAVLSSSRAHAMPFSYHLWVLIEDAHAHDWLVHHTLHNHE